MTDWVPLNVKTLALLKHRKIQGVDTTLEMSPYDIPEAVHGDYNKQSNRFIIEFRYMTDETWANYRYNDDITLRIGRHSRRLYGIEVNMHALTAQRPNVRMNIANAIRDALNGLALKRELTPRREITKLPKMLSKRNKIKFLKALQQSRALW